MSADPMHEALPCDVCGEGLPADLDGDDVHHPDERIVHEACCPTCHPEATS